MTVKFITIPLNLLESYVPGVTFIEAFVGKMEGEEYHYLFSVNYSINGNIQEHRLRGDLGKNVIYYGDIENLVEQGKISFYQGQLLKADGRLVCDFIVDYLSKNHP